MIANASPAPRALGDGTLQDLPAAEPAAPPVTAIRPTYGWQFIDVAELWRFRELVIILAWRDIAVRYKQATIGAAWAIVQPLMTMIVFSIFFGRLARVPSGGIPYPLFALAGLLPWSFFAAAVSGVGSSVLNSAHLVTKVYFPRLAIPLAALGVAAADFAVALGLLCPMMVFYKVNPGPGLLLVPVIILLTALAALGLGTFLAALCVANRDFKHLIPFLIQLGMYATPTVYMQPNAVLGGWLAALMVLNPMVSLIAAFRAATLGGPIPWGPLGVAAALIATLLVAGCLYFRKVEDDFADII